MSVARTREHHRPVAVVHPVHGHRPDVGDLGVLVWYARGRYVVYWRTGDIDEVRRDRRRRLAVPEHGFTVAIVTRDPEAVAREYGRCRAALEAACRTCEASR